MFAKCQTKGCLRRESRRADTEKCSRPTPVGAGDRAKTKARRYQRWWPAFGGETPLGIGSIRARELRGGESQEGQGSLERDPLRCSHCDPWGAGVSVSLRQKRKSAGGASGSKINPRCEGQEALKGQAQGGTDAGSLVKYPRPERRFPLASKTPAGRAAYQLPQHSLLHS
jgi:hypothetical protein